MDDKIDLTVNSDMIKLVYERIYPDKKITNKQVADALSKLIVEALENTTKKTREELEEMWGMK